MKTVDLFGSELQGLSPFVNAQQRLNVFYEIIPSGEKGVNVYSRWTPGYKLFTTLPVNKIQGFLVVGNTLYVVASGKFFSVNTAGGVTSIGTMSPTNTTQPISMATNGNQVLVCNGQSGYIYYINSVASVGQGITGSIATDSFTAGSGYTGTGTYTNVALTGGTGASALATIVVSGGAVTSATITNVGAGYTVNDILTTANTNIGGAGTGFTLTVLTVTVAAGQFVKINDPNFYGGATSCCYLNGFFIINNAQPGQWSTSTIYDGTSWPALNFATAATVPDVLVALDAWNGTLILWGQTHIEFWQDTGNYPFPFTQLVGTAQNWGLAAPHSRCAFNNSFIFLGTSISGHVQVMMMNGYTPQRVSDHNIENIINGFLTTNDAIGFSYGLDGHIFYQLTFPTANRSFLYDGITGLWSELQSGLGSTQRHNANFGVAFNQSYYISDTTSGNIYEFDGEYLTDNGTPIKRQMQTRHIEDGGNNFGVSELWLDVSLGQGLQSSQGSNPQMMLQVSKDNGNTWGNELWTSVGSVGQYQAPRCIWRRLGQSRDFVFKFTFTDPVALVIVKGSLTVRPTTEKEMRG